LITFDKGASANSLSCKSYIFNSIPYSGEQYLYFPKARFS